VLVGAAGVVECVIVVVVLVDVEEPRESEFCSMSPGSEVVPLGVVEVVVAAGVVECVIVVVVLVDVVVVVVSTGFEVGVLVGSWEGKGVGSLVIVIGEKVGAQGIMHGSVTRHIQLPFEHSHFKESYV